jgi:hypothetical protein
MGTELAKFAIEIVGFRVARFLKPIFNALRTNDSSSQSILNLFHSKISLAIHWDFNVIAEDCLYSPNVIEKAEL